MQSSQWQPSLRSIPLPNVSKADPCHTMTPPFPLPQGSLASDVLQAYAALLAARSHQPSVPACPLSPACWLLGGGAAVCQQCHEAREDAQQHSIRSHCSGTRRTGAAPCEHARGQRAGAHDHIETLPTPNSYPLLVLSFGTIDGSRSLSADSKGMRVRDMPASASAKA